MRCGHRGCTAAFTEQWGTWPNVVTAVRTIATVVAWAVAVTTGGDGWLLAALLCYWVGDIADGLLARVTHRETRTGAVLDVLADRLSVCLVVVTYVGTHPAAAVPAAVFLGQFVVIDAYLTLAFARWSLLSPNYFGLVDATVHRLNWSAPAKATNTGAVLLVWLLTGSTLAATVLATVVLGVKSYSALRLARLPVPQALSGCAVKDMHAAISRGH
ncbi:MAG: CDP-alcohol phosphatidyltransferase family protein [Pseudonocardiaceae bacterium]